MKLDKDNLKNYDTLPELLLDLKELSQGCSKWHAQIFGGGDYHDLRFSQVDSQQLFIPNILDTSKDEEFKHTYPSMDALLAELDYIKEYITDNEQLGEVELKYYVLANGGQPFLKVELNGSELVEVKCPVNDVNQEIKVFFKEGIKITGWSLMMTVPLLVVAKYMGFNK